MAVTGRGGTGASRVWPGRLAVVAAALAVAAMLGYLRDPPWLIDVTSGLSDWATDDAGVRYRWTSGHASFFLPSEARYAVLRVRSVNETPSDRPITATISIDDRLAQQVTFPDESWHEVKLVLPTGAARHVRRIDIRLNRLRSHQRGVQLQAPELH